MAKQSQILDCYVDWRNTELQLVLTREQFESYDLKKYFYFEYNYDLWYDDDSSGERVYQTVYKVNWCVLAWKIGYMYKKTNRRQIELDIFLCKTNHNFVDIVFVARCNKIVNKDFQRKYFTVFKIVDYYTRVESTDDVFRIISDGKFLEPIKNAAREFIEEIWREKF